MNLKQMEYFTAIVGEGSISGAARSLHISQPPLSAQIRQLEEELGVTLFDRGSRAIRLTEAGRLFYNRAVSILEMTKAARKELKQLEDGLLGTLRLGMISSVETQGIITSIASFRRRYPGMSFRISEGNTYQLLDKLTTGQIDAALVRTPFPEESFDCRYLTEEPMLAVGRADFFPADCGPKLPLKELAALPLIIYRRWESVLGRMFPHPQPEYLCVNDDARTSLMWAASGVGVAVVPASIVNGWQSAPFPMTAKIISSPPLTRTIALVKLKNAGLSAVGQHFFQSFQVPEHDESAG